MNKILLFLSPLLFLTSCSGWTTPPASANPIKRKEQAVNYIYEINSENDFSGVQLKSLEKASQVNFDLNYTNFDFGNSLKAIPSTIGYFDCLDPNNNFLGTEKSLKINTTDDFYALKNEDYPGGENGYFYHFVLQNYRSNFYFNDDVSRTSFYIPTLNLFDLNHYVTSNNVTYLRIPYLMINNTRYIDLLYQGNSWYFEALNDSQIITYTDYYLLFEFDTIEHITDFQLFENYHYHSYYEDTESQFIEKPGYFIPSFNMANKYVSLPFEIVDIDYEKYCQLRFDSTSFSSLIARSTSTSINSWANDSPSFTNYYNAGEFTYIPRNNWLPNAVNGSNQLLDKIQVTITDAHGVYDEKGVYHPSVETKSDSLIIDHTDNIGGPSGKLLYQYFPNFPAFERGSYGALSLDKIYFYAHTVNTPSMNFDTLQTYDLSNFTKFKFTFDYRQTVRIAYYHGVKKDAYYSNKKLGSVATSASQLISAGINSNYVGSLWNSAGFIFNNIKKEEYDSVIQYYAFDLSFSEKKYLPIPNVQKVEFSYRINKQDCHRSLKLNEKGFTEITTKGQTRVYEYNKLDTDGFGFFTQDEFLSKNNFLKNSDGEVCDYLFVHQLSGQLEPLVTEVNPVAIYYLEDSELSFVSQAVTNDLGLHYDDKGNCYDKDNNLRLDYKVVKNQYIDPATGDVTEWDDIVNVSTGEVVKPNTGTNEDLGDNLNNTPSEWDKILSNVGNFFNDVGKTINSWFSGEALGVVQAIFWIIISIIVFALLIKLIRAILGSRKGRRKR